MRNAPPPQDIQEKIDGLLSEARKQLATKGHVSPAAVILGDGVVTIDPSARTDAEKDQIAFMIREMVKIENANMVALITEIWTLPDDMSPARQQELMIKYRQPSACPERVEKVFVNIEYRDGRSWAAFAQILRKGRVITLAKAEITETTGKPMMGRYTGFFAPEKPMPSAEHLADVVEASFATKH